jgi:DNA-directed RNA polymerase specialized sigma24 family protein
MDFETAEGGVRELPAADADHAERVFHDEFVRAVFARAVDETRERCAASGHGAHFRLFERYDLADREGLSYADLAREAELTVSQVTNHLALVRRRFRDAVLAALRELSGSDAEYREDARGLLGVEVE